MKSLTWKLLLVSALGVSGANATDLQNIVRVDAGYVVGTGTGTSVRVFKGVPFAAAPTGELRWRAPQPPKPWTTLRSAKSFSPSCPQSAVAALNSAAAEDCLTINIWTPSQSGGAKLPVLVSIYGGGFQAGASAATIYDGERLAAQGVVVVSFNYRLGILGFLAHPELSKESSEQVSGNYALLDMIAALKWIRANIAGFGGDASNVTIWGESAGGTAVAMLLVAPQAQGLFHKAIANSPWSIGYPIAHLRNSAQGRPSAEEMGSRLGTLASLRSLSVGDLIKLNAKSGNNALTIDPYGSGESFRPIVDGRVIPDDPSTLLSRGQFSHVPLIVSTTADEGGFFAPRINSIAQARIWLKEQFGAEGERLGSLYKIDSDGQVAPGISRLTGDALMGMGARALLRTAAKTQSNVYQYHFTRVNGVSRRTGIGVNHGADLGYLYGTLPDSVLSLISPMFAALPDDYNAVDQHIADVLMAAIVQFAKTGVPNGKRLPRWQPYGREEAYLEIGDNISMKMRLHERQLDALDTVYARKR